MIVEDQREVSRLLRSALETLEHNLQVVEIFSGEEAILDSSRNTVDLLITDYRLPGISGIALMQKVRSFHPTVKVILITGLTDPKVRREVAEAGADAFFIKPVPIADFLDSVERHLGLVEAALPAEPIMNEDDTVVRIGLPDLLAGLRQELVATTLILFNENGRILARAGDLPDSGLEIPLMSSLMALFSAGQKLSNLIGQEVASSWHVFDGGDLDLIFAPVTTGHAMFVLGKDLTNEDVVLSSVAKFASARGPIEEALRMMTLSASVQTTSRPEPVPAGEETHEEIDPALEPLFKDAKKKLKPDEVEAFWSEVANNRQRMPTKPDMLSYDQARQLGLAPAEDT